MSFTADIERKIWKREEDFYIREWNPLKGKGGTVTFKHGPSEPFEYGDYDWYIIVALEKADKLTADRHLLTQELIMRYRWAIREGYNHQLDPNLKKQYDYPRNQNTIKGILGYIAKIEKASDEEMEALGIE